MLEPIAYVDMGGSVASSSSDPSETEIKHSNTVSPLPMELWGEVMLHIGAAKENGPKASAVAAGNLAQVSRFHANTAAWVLNNPSKSYKTARLEHLRLLSQTPGPRACIQTVDATAAFKTHYANNLDDADRAELANVEDSWVETTVLDLSIDEPRWIDYLRRLCGSGDDSKRKICGCVATRISLLASSPDVSDVDFRIRVSLLFAVSPHIGVDFPSLTDEPKRTVLDMVKGCVGLQTFMAKYVPVEDASYLRHGLVGIHFLKKMGLTQGQVDALDGNLRENNPGIVTKWQPEEFIW